MSRPTGYELVVFATMQLKEGGAFAIILDPSNIDQRNNIAAFLQDVIEHGSFSSLDVTFEDDMAIITTTETPPANMN